MSAAVGPQRPGDQGLGQGSHPGYEWGTHLSVLLPAGWRGCRQDTVYGHRAEADVGRWASSPGRPALLKARVAIPGVPAESLKYDPFQNFHLGSFCFGLTHPRGAGGALEG